MKILLIAINSKYIHSNPAVYSLASYADCFRESIEIAEYTINNEMDRILQDIYRRKPDVLCFSCYIWNIEYVCRVAGDFHELRPDVPLWVGGPEVTYETDGFLKDNPFIKGIMTGEGEATFKELACFYTGGTGDKGLSDINGLVFKEGSEIFHTPAREPMNMDDLPFMYENAGDFENRIIYYESQRGCPFSCSYCLSSIDKSLRFRSIEKVKNELAFFLEKKVPQVKFVDRTFNCRHEHAYTIWKFINDNDNGMTNFHFEISADLLKDEDVALFTEMRPGLIQLEIGVQSTNPATIAEIHRTMKLDRVKEYVLKIQKPGNIHEHLDLIAGLPFEDYETFKNSFNEIYAVKPDDLQLGFLKVLKGSFMYEHAEEYGIIRHKEPPYEVMCTKWISYDEILEIKLAEDMLEIYYNSGQFREVMKIIEFLSDSAFDMFLKLGRFHEKKGYLGMNHTRLKRAQIILEYCEENLAEEYSEMIKQALTFDLYSRENCNTRPEWAPDRMQFKDMCRKYGISGKLAHIEPFDYSFGSEEIRTREKLPEKLKKPEWIIFRYDLRNPLDNQAFMQHVWEV